MGGRGRGGRGEEKGCGTAVRTKKTNKKNTALAQIGTETYCTHSKRPAVPGKQEEAAAREKGAEKHAGLRFGIDVKGAAIHSGTGGKRKEKKQAQETCPENKNSERGVGGG